MQPPGSSRSACAASTSPFDYATRLQEGLAQIFDFLKSHRTRGPTTGDRPFFLEIDLECAVDRFADDRELAALNRRRCTSRQTTGIRMTRPLLSFRQVIDGVRFATDSPLERSGFEPSVRRDTDQAFNVASGWFPANRKVGAKENRHTKRRAFPCGTDGSNPVPSSGESANLCSARSVC